MKNYPAGTFIVVTDTFASGTIANVPAAAQLAFNASVTRPNPRGLYIGGPTGEVSDVIIEDEARNVIPFYNLAHGVVHPIYPRVIVNGAYRGGNYTTTARNLIILY